MPRRPSPDALDAHWIDRAARPLDQPPERVALDPEAAVASPPPIAAPYAVFTDQTASTTMSAPKVTNNIG